MELITIQKISITDIEADAIVNAANKKLKAGSGVCEAIFKAAGYDKLKKACDALKHCDTGSAVITDGFDTKAKYIIHAVGPKWHGGKHKEPELLYGAYQKSLELALEKNCHSIVFPLISSGHYGYPNDLAWKQALQACGDFQQKHQEADIRIIFAVLDDGLLEIGQKILDGGQKENNADYPENINAIGFVNEMIENLSLPVLGKLKDMLLEDYIEFSVMPEDAISNDMLAEKICDFFKMVELRTGKSFEKQIESYMNNLNAIIEPKIAKASNVKKGDENTVIVPRARKYYEKAIRNKGYKNLTMTQLTDYSRLMMSLYSSIIENGGEIIENFEYDVNELDPWKIIEGMEKEEVAVLLAKRRKFDMNDPYGSDKSTMVISILLLWSIVNERIEETNYE